LDPGGIRGEVTIGWWRKQMVLGRLDAETRPPQPRVVFVVEAGEELGFHAVDEKEPESFGH